ncbi:alpha/beta hydrolase [Oryzihumus sp.]|uniref:alpha/beta hydrolase n=1 Tax=Oryzihumus sp. TaxID=1968903 RepID=UPI002ED9BA17
MTPAARSAADPPKVLDRWIRFRLPDPEHRFSAVRLDVDSVLPSRTRDLVRRDGRWELRLPRPGVQRLEYTFTATGPDGVATLTDPANPARVESAFGPRSVVELPGYLPPAWLAREGVPGRFDAFAVAGETTDPVPVTVWSPADAADVEPLPLLVVHDGPEYDQLASLTRFCAVQVADAVLPRHRVALLQPVQRSPWYSGSPQYLRTLTGPVLTTLARRYAVSAPMALMGASLGGLTSLLAGLQAPVVGAVFAQSGSFFQAELDGMEQDFPWFPRIVDQVRAVLATRHTDHPLVVGLTCGALEENAPNNRAMATALARAGHTVRHTEVPDLHNYTAWRDALDPHLTDVLRDCWITRG